jgi:hypothetical protein
MIIYKITMKILTLATYLRLLPRLRVELIVHFSMRLCGSHKKNFKILHITLHYLV